MDILTLIHSSECKFLREIFKLESTETKLGHGTIRQAKAGNQLFKVGVPPAARDLSALRPQVRRAHASAQGRPTAWGPGFSVR